MADFVFCCFGGGAFFFFETLLLVFAPRVPDWLGPLELGALFLFLIVLVGPILPGSCAHQNLAFALEFSKSRFVH